MASLINQTQAFDLRRELFRGCFLHDPSLWLSWLDVIFMPFESHCAVRISANNGAHLQWRWICKFAKWVRDQISSGKKKKKRKKIAAEISFCQAVLFSRRDWSATLWTSAISFQVFEDSVCKLYITDDIKTSDAGRPVIKLMLSDQGFFFFLSFKQSGCYKL